MGTIYMTFNCLTSLHPGSYSLIENRSNVVYHWGTSFNESMLIHDLEALPCAKEGSEQLPPCTKLQGVSSRCVQVVCVLVPRSCKMPTPLEFRRRRKRDLGCPAWHCLRRLRGERRSQETSLHTKAADAEHLASG